MSFSEEHRQLLTRRVTDVFREVGTLLLAFAPLDYFLQPTLDLWSLAGFIGVGTLLFIWSLVREIGGER